MGNLETGEPWEILVLIEHINALAAYRLGFSRQVDLK
jgi:hypothetical protein